MSDNVDWRQRDQWMNNGRHSAQPIEAPSEKPVEPGGRGPHDPGMEARVAVLEHIAKETKDTLVDLRSEMRNLRSEIGAIRSDARADYRWLLGIMLGMGAGILGALAKGFHWF